MELAGREWNGHDVGETLFVFLVVHIASSGSAAGFALFPILREFARALIDDLAVREAAVAYLEAMPTPTRIGTVSV
ncbi:hypothetical protein [Streptomyces sp. ISL-86]|uniref:hypothetical protein n=1 Tax=Streptomyces sp. ISL-86 TaxID=2819187 RepID=UPI001BE9F87B|nr:hypothetical protein [Streptomyces sp. ISL-86]MBT2458877.1 hypothetical protein [Streptomyces sp. ISL-86]